MVLFGKFSSLNYMGGSPSTNGRLQGYGTVLYLTRSLLSRMDPGARLGLGGGARACRLDSFFGFLVLPGLVDLIRFAVFAKNRTSGRHRLSPPGFV